MKVIFRKNLVTNEYVYDERLSKMCTEKVNLQYHVMKHCWSVQNIKLLCMLHTHTHLQIRTKVAGRRLCQRWHLPSKGILSVCRVLTSALQGATNSLVRNVLHVTGASIWGDSSIFGKKLWTPLWILWHTLHTFLCTSLLCATNFLSSSMTSNFITIRSAIPKRLRMYGQIWRS